MLYLNNQRVIENVLVYGDDKEYNVFYPIPEQPRFRLDDKGRPIFKFLKYRFPIDRADGKKGGGFAVFDVEFTVPDEKMAIIKNKLQEEVNVLAQKNTEGQQQEEAQRRAEAQQEIEELLTLNTEESKKQANLKRVAEAKRQAEVERQAAAPIPEVRIGAVNYTKGTSRLILNSENSVLIERILDAGKPSLYGKNISTYSIELSVEGATLFEAALQGKGGFVGVMYELYHDAKLPQIKVEGRFNADSFYSFVQEINVNERICRDDDYKETLSEVMTQSESKTLTIDPGSSKIDPKVIDQIRTWAQSSLDDAAERLMIEALPVEDPESAREWYKKKGIESVRKEITRNRISDFTIRYNEESYIDFNINPQGVMPNITTLTDYEGNPILWNDYAQEVDLNDPFFKQLNVTVKVNAPFSELPIHSVEVKLMYKGEPMKVMGTELSGEYQFSSPDDIARFATYVKDDDFNYSYSYQVNYIGAAKIFQSKEIVTNEAVLTVNVDDIGILLVQIVPGDIDFKQIKQAQLLLEYEDTSSGIDKISDQFILTEATPVHRFEHIIFSKRSKPYRYKLNYKLIGGKEFEGQWQQGNANRLIVNDPFTQSKTIGFRASGDLVNDIENIFIDVVYKDEGNNYQFSQSITLHQDNPFYDLYIPMIDKNIDSITYKGSLLRKNGTHEEIPETTTDATTILVGANIENHLEITVMPSLLDFETTVKLAHIQLEYTDADKGVDERKDFTFMASASNPQKWLVKVKDKTKKTYNYKATYYFKDGSKKEVLKEGVSDLTVFLESPIN